MAALAVLASWCSCSVHKNSQAPAAPTTRPAAKRKALPVVVKAAPTGPVRIAPASGTVYADPSAGITVTTSRGTLQSVTVRTSATPFPAVTAGAAPSRTASARSTCHRSTL